MFKKTILATALITAIFPALAKSNKDITIEVLGTYDATPPGEFDSGAAEIVAYDPRNWTLFVTNASLNTVDLLNIQNQEVPTSIGTLDVASDLAKETGISESNVGGVNSVAVNGNRVAVAVENDNPIAPGWIAFYQTDGTYTGYANAGVLPDSVTFTPDGHYALSANEGQPVGDYLNAIDDPEGSVTIIDLSNGVGHPTPTTTADFTAFNGGAPAGVRTPLPSKVQGKPTTVAQDLEPEYIATSADSMWAYVTLQENNAIAVVDIPKATVTQLLPLGSKDHSRGRNALDASNEDGPDGEGRIRIKPWPVRGMYMPDTIVTVTIRDKEYLVTANEGDSREYGYETDESNCPDEQFLEDGSYYEYSGGECVYLDEARVKDLAENSNVFAKRPNLQDDRNLGRLKIVSTEGLTPGGDGSEHDKLYSFGARSFSVWDTNGNLVFDSGKTIEKESAKMFPGNFNSNNDENKSFDSRSDDKGPEPEGVAVGMVDGRTYAFVGLERIGGVMIFNITRPEKSKFVAYVNNRNFDAGDDSGDVEDDVNANPSTVGDLGPESLVFIKGEDSPTGDPLLAVGNEVSGTTTIYKVIPFKSTRGNR